MFLLVEGTGVLYSSGDGPDQDKKVVVKSVQVGHGAFHFRGSPPPLRASSTAVQVNASLLKVWMN